MRKRIKSHLRALDDAALLAIYAACWLLAFFAPSNQQLALATTGRVLSAVGATVVLVLWLHRRAHRPGLWPRDLSLMAVVVLSVASATMAPIRQVGLFDFLQTLHLAAIFLIAAYLCLRRPLPLFAITLLLLVLATYMVWRWPSMFPALNAVRLGEVAALAFLAFLPWFAARQMRAVARWYGWLVLALAVGLAALEATSGILGNPSWIDSLLVAFPSETRQTVGGLLQGAWLWGCGPGHYPWVFRATMPEEFAGQSASLPGAVLLLVENGVIGFGATLVFAAAMLWRFRPGRWAAQNDDLLALARPLRYLAAYTLLLYLATPSLRSPFASIVLWSFFGMLRSWSSKSAPVIIPSALDQADSEKPQAAGFEHGHTWPQHFLLVGVLLAGIGLIFMNLRPLVAVHLRQRPAGLALNDSAYLKRLERAVRCWPHDPLTHERIASHYRAKVNLSDAEIQAVTRAYARMVGVNPYDPLSHQMLAHWHEIPANFDLDRGLREKAQGDPQKAKLYLEKARTSFRKAAEAARRGLAYCPASFELQFQLAGYYMKLDDFEQARRAFERARQLGPHFVPTLINLALLELRSNNAAAAQRYLQLAAQLDPDNPSLRALLDAIRSGKADEVRDRLEKLGFPAVPPEPAPQQSP